MRKIPKAKIFRNDRISVNNIDDGKKNDCVLFSFEAIEKNDYFNLDGTCSNWAADLFDMMQKVSKISIKDIYAKKYSGKHSPLRIHPHMDAHPPCSVPENVSLDDMWQMRISVSKGGIHGVFSENIFYVIWFDPHHNLYPDENHGGLKRVIPPSTCCKDREIEIKKLKRELENAKEELKLWEELVESEKHLKNAEEMM